VICVPSRPPDMDAGTDMGTDKVKTVAHGPNYPSVRVLTTERSFRPASSLRAAGVAMSNAGTTGDTMAVLSR
jgi:hypothetical protein